MNFVKVLNSELFHSEGKIFAFNHSRVLGSMSRDNVFKMKRALKIEYFKVEREGRIINADFILSD